MYRIVGFGFVDLEHYNQVDVIGTGSAPTAYINLPEGGALDPFGSQQKHPGSVERTKSLRLHGATAAATEQLFLNLLSLRGKRDRLYRRTASGDIHWMYARLVEVTAQRSYELTPYKTIQDVELRFITQEAFWRGDYSGKWYFDNGEFFDTGLSFNSGQQYALTSSPTAFTISIGTDAGRAPSRAIQISVVAGSAPITALTIARTNGETITFSASILSGKTLLIDTGTMQVTNDGADAYNSLTLAPTADLASWFALQPGDNQITVTFTGGGTGSTIDFVYYESWY